MPWPHLEDNALRYTLTVRELWARVHRPGGYYTDICTSQLLKYFDAELNMTYRLCITPEEPDQRKRNRRYIEARLMKESRLPQNPLHVRFANAEYWANVVTTIELDEWLEDQFEYETTYYVWLEFTQNGWKLFSERAWKCKCCYTLNVPASKKCVRCQRPKIGRPVGKPKGYKHKRKIRRKKRK